MIWADRLLAPREGPRPAGGRRAGLARISRSRGLRRVAMLSVHTSPLDTPGGGDAGGMNVYVVETAQATCRRAASRSRSSPAPPPASSRATVEMDPGVTVRHVTAGPFEGLAKQDLPGQLCAFTAGVMRAEARHEPGWYDLIHSHYWLSGQVGWLLARERWGVPLVHSAHTLAQGEERLARHRRPAGAVAARDRRGAGGRRGRPADRLDRRRRPRELVDRYDADPAHGAHHRPRRRPRRLHARLGCRGPPAARPRSATRSRCCSSVGSSR